jgi:hypothetical protein
VIALPRSLTPHARQYCHFVAGVYAFELAHLSSTRVLSARDVNKDRQHRVVCLDFSFFIARFHSGSASLLVAAIFGHISEIILVVCLLSGSSVADGI